VAQKPSADGLVKPEEGDRSAAAVRHPAATPASNPYAGVGRNDPCPCGSGKKFKKCHGAAV
jgi:preprotein translocase subunit SecA